MNRSRLIVNIPSSETSLSFPYILTDDPPVVAVAAAAAENSLQPHQAPPLPLQSPMFYTWSRQKPIPRAAPPTSPESFCVVALQTSGIRKGVDCRIRPAHLTVK